MICSQSIHVELPLARICTTVVVHIRLRLFCHFTAIKPRYLPDNPPHCNNQPSGLLHKLNNLPVNWLLTEKISEQRSKRVSRHSCMPRLQATPIYKSRHSSDLPILAFTA